MISLRQAKKLTVGETLYHTTNRNADGSPQRWKVNGKVKTWKTQPGRATVPIKHGLYAYDYLTETCLDIVATTEKQALRKRSI